MCNFRPPYSRRHSASPHSSYCHASSILYAVINTCLKSWLLEPLTVIFLCEMEGNLKRDGEKEQDNYERYRIPPAQRRRHPSARHLLVLRHQRLGFFLGRYGIAGKLDMRRLPAIQKTLGRRPGRAGVLRTLPSKHQNPVNAVSRGPTSYSQRIGFDLQKEEPGMSKPGLLWP